MSKNLKKLKSILLVLLFASVTPPTLYAGQNDSAIFEPDPGTGEMACFH